MKSRIVILFLLAITTSQVLSAAIDITIQEDDLVTDENGQTIDTSGDDVIRIKRSGSPDFFGYIKKGITSKISQIAQASAGASAHFSKGSSGSRGYYDHPTSYPNKSYDFWNLKKAILNTLFQAVKAINGGIIAIKGQLIKGSGAIISAKGRLVSMKGDAITNLGKNIIGAAKLIPHPSSHSKPEVVEYSAPTGHTGPSAISHPGPSAISHPGPSYGPPSGPSSPSGSAHTGGGVLPSASYGGPTSAAAYGPPIGPGASAPSQAYLPQKLTGHYEAYKSKPHGAHAGIVIVKKIPEKEMDRPHPSIAHLPLQDERNKVVDSFEIGKPVAPNLFTPEDVKPIPAQLQNYHETHSKPDTSGFFESSIKGIPPPKVTYGSPIEDTPPNAPPSAPLSAPPREPYSAPPQFPPSPSLHEFNHGPELESPPGYIDDSLLHDPNVGFNQNNFNQNAFSQNSFNSHSGLSSHSPHYFKNAAKPQAVEIKNIHNIFPNSDNLFHSKVPSPSETNSFGGPYSQFGGSFPGPFSLNPEGPGSNYAQAINLGTSGVQSLPFNSNLQYNRGISDVKGTFSLPEFDIVKSVSYDLPIGKRTENKGSAKEKRTHNVNVKNINITKRPLTERTVEKRNDKRTYAVRHFPIIKRIEIIH